MHWGYIIRNVLSEPTTEGMGKTIHKHTQATALYNKYPSCIRRTNSTACTALYRAHIYIHVHVEFTSKNDTVLVQRCAYCLFLNAKPADAPEILKTMIGNTRKVLWANTHTHTPARQNKSIQPNWEKGSIENGMDGGVSGGARGGRGG